MIQQIAKTLTSNHRADTVVPVSTGRLYGSQHIAASQRGVALIVVLGILILISLVAAIAMRLSGMNQDISKNAQANKLLKQASDVPMGILSRRDSDSEVQTFMSDSGPLGFLRMDGNTEAEYVLCYQPTLRKKLFSSGQHLIHVAGGGSTGNVAGYCKIDSSSDAFSSKRRLTVTQVSVIRPNRSVTGLHPKTDAVIKPFEVVEEGTDNQSIKRQPPTYYRVYSTAVLPTMSLVSSDSAINNCLQKPIGGLADPASSGNMGKCLEEENVPALTQVQDFIFKANISKS